MYSGTGSFVSSVSSIGFPGTSPVPNSKYLTKRSAPVPLYALSENLDKNPDQEGRLGPDEENDAERTIDRDKENFQRFLNEIDRQFQVKKQDSIENQNVLDSFELFKEGEKDAFLSNHALQIISETLPILRNEKKSLEIIIWATMPSPVIIEKYLNLSMDVTKEIDARFTISPSSRKRMKIVVKPWLFSDAKRPVISFVVGDLSKNN
jgi:hypothetical protein